MSDEVEVSVLQSKPEDDPTKAQEARLSGILQASDCEFLKMEPELRKNIRKNFLDLKITVCIQLSLDEVAGLKDPVPYYVSGFPRGMVLTLPDPDEPSIESLHLRG